MLAVVTSGQSEPSRWNTSAVNSKLWAATRANTASSDDSFRNVNRRSARLDLSS